MILSEKTLEISTQQEKAMEKIVKFISEISILAEDLKELVYEDNNSEVSEEIKRLRSKY